jgi:predicted  nucleic acid-binding Zn-ribbon protein
MINIAILFELQKNYDDEQILKRKLKDSQNSLLTLTKQFEIIIKEKVETSEKIHQLKIRLSDENFKLQTEETNLKKINHELYTTQQSNPKYLKDLESKIQDLSKISESEEETIIYLMDDMDLLTKKQNLILQQEEEIQEALDMKRKSYESLEKLTKEDLFNLSLCKESLREQLEEDILQIFDQMMLKCQGKAIATLLKGECSVCRFLVPLSQVDIIKKKQDQIHYCSNCKRILIAI